MASYVPSTREERKEMLASLGLHSVEELFSQIPDEVLLKSPLQLPKGKTEADIRKEMEALAAKNVVFQSVFRGGGAYRHYIPALVSDITSKETFLTAYTPYQAEISQGILQSIFEYQTMICELTGMDVSNASVYDGASAAAEATAMCRERKRTKALVSAAAHPDVIQTIKTYNEAVGAQVCLIPVKDGKTDLNALAAMIDETTASVYLQQPNYFGQLEDGEECGRIAHEGKVKFILGCNPIALGILKTPGELGADVAVGEGQPLGMELGFGGPYLGFMAATKGMMRKLPGRIVGETTDVDGNRAFVLTLQAREQHIRREKASSNICSNQALCAMTATVYLTVMGPSGLAECASLCLSNAHYLAKKLCEIPGLSLRDSGEFFHEFVTVCSTPAEKICEKLEEKGILGGLPLNEKEILWCATEMNGKEEMDELVALMKEVVCK